MSCWLGCPGGLGGSARDWVSDGALASCKQNRVPVDTEPDMQPDGRPANLSEKSKCWLLGVLGSL